MLNASATEGAITSCFAPIILPEKYDKYSFKFGTVKTEYLGQEIQITTFRKEGEYLDSRHPNTIKFINDFEIVSSEASDKFNDAWRIFDKYGYKSPKKWPEDTSMRRAFKNHVLSGGKTGHGHGIIVFDGEKIVR